MSEKSPFRRGNKRGHNTGHAHREHERRRQEAEERQAAYAALTPADKIRRLDARGATATRERYRIAAKEVG